jgi:homoserine kinase type II
MKEVKKVLDEWSIGKIKRIKFSRAGEVNYNWLVETEKGKFFLRRFASGRSLKDLKFEIDYLNTLRENGFSYKIPSPCKTKNGKYIVRFLGKYFWLDNFIEGKIKEKLGMKDLREIAKMLSGYHGILEKTGLRCDKDNNDMSIKLVLEEIKFFVQKLDKKKINEIEKIYLREVEKLVPILQKINSEEYSKLKKYAIHRDLNPENLLWKGSKISGVLDFENVSRGNDCFVKDICIILQYGASENHKLNIKKAKFFLNEYMRYRKITKKEIKLIPEIMTAGYIEDFEYQYWKTENDKKRATPHRLKLYSEAAQWFWNNKEKIGKLIG